MLRVTLQPPRPNGSNDNPAAQSCIPSMDTINFVSVAVPPLHVIRSTRLSCFPPILLQLEPAMRELIRLGPRGLRRQVKSFSQPFRRRPRQRGAVECVGLFLRKRPQLGMETREEHVSPRLGEDSAIRGGV